MRNSQQEFTSDVHLVNRKGETMNYEKIVTLYDTAEHAEAARRNLEAAGFAPSDISSINNKTLSIAGDKLRDPGLWHRLFGRDIQQYSMKRPSTAVRSKPVARS
jgi:hypothetical protein